MNDQNDNLKWDRKKHEEVLAKAVSEKEDAFRSKATALVAQEYAKLKAKFLKSKEATRQEVIGFLYKLQAVVANACRNRPEMKGWEQFTVNMIEDKIAVAVATDCGTKNQITEFIPETLAKDEHRLVLPEQAIFETVEDLSRVNFVTRWLSKPGFVGLFRSGLWIKALFDDGTYQNVGIVACKTGITKLPTQEEITKGIGEQ